MCCAAIMRAAGFTDIAPHVSDGDHVGAGGATPKLFRAAAIEDVTFLDVPDPASAQPSHRGAPSGSRHDSMHGSRHGSMHGSMHGSLHGSIHGGHLGVSGHLRGDGGGPAIATPPVVGASPRSGSAAAADVSGAAAPAAPAVPTAKSGLTAVLQKAAGAEAEATAAAAAGAEDQGWARVHVVVLTGAVSASDAPERRMFGAQPHPHHRRLLVEVGIATASRMVPASAFLPHVMTRLPFLRREPYAERRALPHKPPTPRPGDGALDEVTSPPRTIPHHLV